MATIRTTIAKEIEKSVKQKWARKRGERREGGEVAMLKWPKTKYKISNGNKNGYRNNYNGLHKIVYDCSKISINCIRWIRFGREIFCNIIY